jgi:hypothetical protein
MSSNDILYKSNLLFQIPVNSGQVISATHINNILQEIRQQKQYSENQANRNLGGSGFGSQYFENGAIKSKHLDLQIQNASLTGQVQQTIQINQLTLQTTPPTGSFNIVWETLDMRAIIWVTAMVAIELPANTSVCEFQANLQLWHIHGATTYGPKTVGFQQDNTFDGKFINSSTLGQNVVLTKKMTFPFIWAPNAVDAFTNFYFKSDIANFSSQNSIGFNGKLAIESVVYQTFFRIHA